MRERIERRKENVAIWIAWHLPRGIVKWAAIRLGVHATTGRYATTVVPDLTFTAALQRWYA